jgi:HSP20 family protein
MAAVIRWNPWREFVRYNRDLAERLDDEGDACTYRLAVDAYDTADAIVITAAVPGLEPEDIHIKLEDDVLSIEGEFKHEDQDVKYLIRERAGEGHFRRDLRLNVPVKVDNIEATFNNGILTLTVPKAEEAKPLSIPVKWAQN